MTLKKEIKPNKYIFNSLSTYYTHIVPVEYTDYLSAEG